MTDGPDTGAGQPTPAPVPPDTIAADTAAVEEAPPGRRVHSFVREVAETVITFAVCLGLAFAFRTYVIEPFRIPTGSMIPTVMENDQVLVDKLAYRLSSPKPGDIVVLEDPTRETPALLKRVIAIGGQTLDLHDGRVYIDGQPIEETYTYGKPTEPGTVALPVKIAPGTIWVMGDNRTASKDSRYFGAQPVANVRGRAFFTYWPLARWGALR